MIRRGRGSTRVISYTLQYKEKKKKKIGGENLSTELARLGGEREVNINDRTN